MNNDDRAKCPKCGDWHHTVIQKFGKNKTKWKCTLCKHKWSIVHQKF